jgi:hypothetical protein
MNLFHLSLGTLAILALACVDSLSAAGLPMRTLAKGAFSGIQESRQEVIRDEAAWQRFWAQHSTSSRTGGPVPPVDFTKEMVIAVTLGRRTTGGYSIQLTNVEPQQDTLRIMVRRTAPPPGAMAIQALTAPFHFVAVPKSDLKPEFVMTGPEKRGVDKP